MRPRRFGMNVWRPVDALVGERATSDGANDRSLVDGGDAEIAGARGMRHRGLNPSESTAP
jgi:hypothetical protein